MFFGDKSATSDLHKLAAIPPKKTRCVQPRWFKQPDPTLIPELKVTCPTFQRGHRVVIIIPIRSLKNFQEFTPLQFFHLEITQLKMKFIFDPPPFLKDLESCYKLKLFLLHLWKTTLSFCHMMPTYWQCIYFLALQTTISPSSRQRHWQCSTVTKDFWSHARWAPTIIINGVTWGPDKWPYKWIAGVILPPISGVMGPYVGGAHFVWVLNNSVCFFLSGKLSPARSQGSRRPSTCREAPNDRKVMIRWSLTGRVTSIQWGSAQQKVKVVQ